MVDETSQNQDGEAPEKDEAHAPLAGQKLAKARRASDISIAEIAKALHLDEPKVQALEENQFDVLGAPVFAKGHLRKYAELVGVPIEDVLSDYYQVHRSVGAPPVVGPKRKQQRELALGPVIVGLIIVALIIGVAAWFFIREPAQRPSERPGTLQPFAVDAQTDQAQGDSSEAGDAQIDDPPESSPDGDEQTVPDEPVADEASITDTAPALVRDEPRQAATPSAPVSGDQLTVAMRFTGDCWTEVTDANGERLFFGLGRDGQTITRSGAPPFRALFGDRNNVEVSVDGVNFPLRGDGRRGNTARVTLDKP